MSKMVGATGNQPLAVQAARDILDAGGSAVGAVLSGFFTEAGMHSGVLLGPLVVVVAGIGNGVRVFDGRLRQPGLGTKRPRGFTNDDDIPMGARIAVPQAVAAAVVAHAYERSGSFAEVLKRGIRQARLAGADARADVLESIQANGARYLSSPQVARPLLHVAGISEGGLLTPADLNSVPDVDYAARVHPELRDWSVVPWSDDDSTRSIAVSSGAAIKPRQAPENQSDMNQSNSSETMLLCAVDARGIFAGVSYQRTFRGVAIEELELHAPISAIPVRRGVQRLSPGTCLPAPVPLAIESIHGVAVSIVGDSNLHNVSTATVNHPLFRIQRNPNTRRVTVDEQLSEIREFVAEPVH